MHLDKRLLLVASFVRSKSRIADIGTDHAYLPIWLVSKGVCPLAIATDIGTNPASIAMKNIKNAGLESRISVRVGDGLSPVAPDEVDDIIIAGMGGETIAGIINSATWTKNSSYRLILQPMTKHDYLRESILTAGFAIVDECIAELGQKMYPIICSEYNPNTAFIQFKQPAAFIRGGLDRNRDRKYLEKQRNRLLKASLALRKAGKFDKALKLAKLADEVFE